MYWGKTASPLLRSLHGKSSESANAFDTLSLLSWLGWFGSCGLGFCPCCCVIAFKADISTGEECISLAAQPAQQCSESANAFDAFLSSFLFGVV
jgi:hypothetical protein